MNPEDYPTLIGLTRQEAQAALAGETRTVQFIEHDKPITAEVRTDRLRVILGLDGRVKNVMVC